MKYLDIDDIRALELINAEVHDEKLKEKLIKIYMSDIRKKEHDYVRHDSRNISLCSSDSKQVTIIEYELSKDIEDSSAITMRNFLYEELKKAIDQLDDTEKLIIQLFFYEDIPLSDIAKQQGLTKQALSKKKIKIIRKLKKLIKV